MSTFVNNSCHCCKDPLEASPRCGRVIMGRSDGTDLFTADLCGECWSYVNEGLRTAADLLFRGIQQQRRRRAKA